MLRDEGRGFFLVVAVFCLFSLFACTSRAESPRATVTSYEECIAAGFPMMKSLPPKCSPGDGRVFTKGVPVPYVIDRKEPQDAVPPSLCVDRCGNGECEEIVCMAEGCPCSESPESCPADCAPGQR